MGDRSHGELAVRRHPDVIALAARTAVKPDCINGTQQIPEESLANSVLPASAAANVNTHDLFAECLAVKPFQEGAHAHNQNAEKHGFQCGTALEI